MSEWLIPLLVSAVISVLTLVLNTRSSASSLDLARVQHYAEETFKYVELLEKRVAAAEERVDAAEKAHAACEKFLAELQSRFGPKLT